MNRFPWWGSVLLAVLAYTGLKYGVPQFLSETSRFRGLIPLFAPLAAMGFLLLAGKQLYDGEIQEEPGSRDNNAPPEGDQDNK